VTVSDTLERWEGTLSRRFPQLLDRMLPGLDDAGVEELARSLAPYRLPEQVEALYRWKGGGVGVGLFGGWSLRPVDELLRWRELCLTGMDEPPAWLQLFDDQCLGFVTLGAPDGQDPDSSVWYGHTHDCWVERLCDSIEAMVQTCSDAAEAGLLTELHGGLRLAEGESFDGRSWSDLRLARSPGAFRYPDPPAGTYLSRFPDGDWPTGWIESFSRKRGIDPLDLRPRGVSISVQALKEVAHATGGSRGTVQARVVQLAGSGAGYLLQIDDGTGVLDVWCPAGAVVFAPSIGATLEFDVVVTVDSVSEEVPDTSGAHGELQKRALAGDLPGAQEAARRLHHALFETRAAADATAVRLVD
jgi:hypothetical protein